MFNDTFEYLRSEPDQLEFLKFLIGKKEFRLKFLGLKGEAKVLKGRVLKTSKMNGHKGMRLLEELFGCQYQEEFEGVIARNMMGIV